MRPTYAVPARLASGLFPADARLRGAVERVVMAVLLLASLVALARAARGMAGGSLYEWYRQTLARAILLGLEFLVAADIIRTIVVEYSLDSLLKLAAQSMFDLYAQTVQGMMVVDREHRIVWISDGYKSFLPALGIEREDQFVGQRRFAAQAAEPDLGIAVPAVTAGLELVLAVER